MSFWQVFCKLQEKIKIFLTSLGWSELRKTVSCVSVSCTAFSRTKQQPSGVSKNVNKIKISISVYFMTRTFSLVINHNPL